MGVPLPQRTPAVRLYDAAVMLSLYDVLARLRRECAQYSTFEAQPYEEQLKRRVFTLEKRRLLGDLIHALTWLSRFSHVGHSKLFELQTDSRTRNNARHF